MSRAGQSPLRSSHINPIPDRPSTSRANPPRPFDIAKNRLQNQLSAPTGELPRYRHTLQVCALVWREEGALALFKGFSPTVMRIVLGQSVAYASFEFAMAKLQLAG